MESTPELVAGQTTVGFIGLGNLGSALVERMLAAGYSAVLWARRQASVEPFRASEAKIAASPAELAARSDLVGVCVTADSDVDEVLLSDNGVLAGIRPGGIIAVHSTISPASCRRLAAAAAERGAQLLDVPVSGGRNAATAGELLVMVGGPVAVFNRCLPVFRTFGSTIVHLGPVVGSGQLAKLVNNTLLTATMALADEAIDLGYRLGIDETKLSTVLQHGTARSFALDVALVHRASPDPSGLAHTLLSKDVHLLAAVAEGLPDRTECPTDSPLFSIAHLMLDRLPH